MRVGRREAPGVRLRQARPDQNVLHRASKRLVLAQPPAHVPAERHRARHAVEQRAGDLLHEVDLALDVARTPGRDGDVPVVVDLEAEAFEGPELLVRGHLHPDDVARALGAEAHDGRLRKAVVNVDVAGQAGAREIDDHPARQLRRRLREVGIDALLPAVRACRPQGVALRRAHDPDGLEVRGLEQDLGRLLGDLALLAAHDRRERDRALGVGDDEVGLVQPPQRAVERPQLLAGAGAPDDDPPSGELRPVEGVQRAPVHVHHVVRHVDDVRDRARVREVEPRAEPLRRRPDRHVAEDPADVARAAGEVLDGDVDLLRVDHGRILDLRQVQLAAEERGDLAGEPDHREEIDAVDRRRDVEHAVADRAGRRRAACPAPARPAAP